MAHQLIRVDVHTCYALDDERTHSSFLLGVHREQCWTSGATTVLPFAYTAALA